MSSVWARLGPLAAVVFLLIGAGLQLRIAGGTNTANTGFAMVLVTAGLITLGAWLTIEVWHHHDTNRQLSNPEDEGA